MTLISCSCALIHVTSILSNSPALDRGAALGLEGGGESAKKKKKTPGLVPGITGVGEATSRAGSMPTQSMDAPALWHIAEARTGLWESGLGVPGRTLSPSASPPVSL